MNNAFIAGNEVYLRPLRLADVDAGWVEWFNDQEVCRHNNHHRFPKTRAEMIAYLEQTAASTNALVLAIIAARSDKHVGNVSLQNIDWISRSAEFAIIIGDKSAWGGGVGTESGRLIIEHGFKHLNLRRVYCGTAADNTGMQKLAAALGMQEEGRRRQALFKNGAYVDIIEYGVLDSDYDG